MKEETFMPSKAFSTFSSSWQHRGGDYSSGIRFKFILKPVYDWLSLILHWLLAMHFNIVLMEDWTDQCCGSLLLIDVMIGVNIKAEITVVYTARRLSKLSRNQYHLLSHLMHIRISKEMSSSKGATPFFYNLWLTRCRFMEKLPCRKNRQHSGNEI